MASRLSYAARAALCTNNLAKNLFLLLNEKKTNLALSADVTQCNDLLHLAEEVGSEICILKTHIDILEDFHPDFIQALKKIANEKKFFIFEDRKFADIGHTVKNQYEKGIYHIADWAHIVNAHSLPGPGIVAGLAEAGVAQGRGLLLLAEMSSSGHFFTEDYTQKTVKLAEQFPEFVIGFISQNKLASDPKWIYMTPGVQLKNKDDHLGQRYITPQKAIIENQTDIIIVGRGIISAGDPLLVAQQYRQMAWEAYEQCL